MVFQHTFEGHTEGEQITRENSAIGGDPFSLIVIDTAMNNLGAPSLVYGARAAMEDEMGGVLSATPGTTYVRWDETDAGTSGCIRRPLYVPNSPDTTWTLATMRNTLDEYMGSLIVRSNGVVTVDHPTTGTVATGGFQTTPGGVYWAEFACEAGPAVSAGTSRYRIYADDGVTLLHEKINANVNTRTLGVGIYRIGGIVAANGIAEDRLDSIRAGLVAPGAWLGPIPPIAPTLSAIAQQISEPDVLVTVTATRAPGSPMPTTWVWRRVSGPQVTLQPNGASCTFIAPSTMPPGGDTLVIGVTGSTVEGTSEEVFAEIVLRPKLIWSRKAGGQWVGSSIQPL